MSIQEKLSKLGRAISASELAELLSLNKLTIYRLAKNGLPHYRIGAALRFDPHAVAEYLRSHEVRR